MTVGFCTPANASRCSIVDSPGPSAKLTGQCNGSRIYLVPESKGHTSVIILRLVDLGKNRDGGKQDPDHGELSFRVKGLLEQR
jgi:hypothetical protein